MSDELQIREQQFEEIRNVILLHRSKALQNVQPETAQIRGVIVQPKTAQLPNLLLMTTFTNHVEILNRCKTTQQRIFYILYSYKERLKKRELLRCIDNDTFGSLMGDKKNFSTGLLATYPEATSVFKDRAFVDFLNLPQKHSEKQLHKGILENIKQFVLELGKDFLFVDSEYPLHVGGSTFKIDLLFYHRGLQCLVAIELKTGRFKPEYVGQLEFYLEALDRDVKRSNENPSIGILLCQTADHSVVEYAISRSMSPTMVAEYKRQLIPKEVMQKSLDEFCTFLMDSKK